MAGSDTPESDWDTTLNDINIQLEDNRGILYYQQNSIKAANLLEKNVLETSCMTTEELFDWNIYACHPLLIRDMKNYTDKITGTNLIEIQELKNKKYILYLKRLENCDDELYIPLATLRIFKNIYDNKIIPDDEIKEETETKIKTETKKTSFYTFYDVDSYSSPGAFKDIVIISQQNYQIKMEKIDYIESFYNNLGFLYQIYKEELSDGIFGKNTKIIKSCKYLHRIYNAYIQTCENKEDIDKLLEIYNFYLQVDKDRKDEQKIINIKKIDNINNNHWIIQQINNLILLKGDISNIIYNFTDTNNFTDNYTNYDIKENIILILKIFSSNENILINCKKMYNELICLQILEKSGKGCRPPIIN